jgi:hypothetical protein
MDFTVVGLLEHFSDGDGGSVRAIDLRGAVAF